MQLKIAIVLLCFLVVVPTFSYAQIDDHQDEEDVEKKAYTPPPVDKRKLRNLIIIESGIYTTGVTGSYFLWYKNTMGGGFHFFNDSKEWLMMDKMGHFTTNYLMAQYVSRWYTKTGINERKADRIAALQTFLVLGSIEIFDGFSRDWGFSIADIGFNALGTGTYYFSKRIKNITNGRINFIPKFTYGKSVYAQYRPAVLGKDLKEQILKDYNGQTYWLSFNLNNLISPALYWGNVVSGLCVSFGYGANGMTGGHDNVLINEAGQSVPYFERYRQFYFSLDLDLTKIETYRFPFLGRILKAINILKFPFPALELSRGNVFINWTSYGM